MFYFNTLLQISLEPCEILLPAFDVTQPFLRKPLQERCLQWYSMVRVQCGSDFGECCAVPHYAVCAGNESERVDLQGKPKVWFPKQGFTTSLAAIMDRPCDTICTLTSQTISGNHRKGIDLRYFGWKSVLLLFGLDGNSQLVGCGF